MRGFHEGMNEKFLNENGQFIHMLGKHNIGTEEIRMIMIKDESVAEESKL